VVVGGCHEQIDVLEITMFCIAHPLRGEEMVWFETSQRTMRDGIENHGSFDLAGIPQRLMVLSHCSPSSHLTNPRLQTACKPPANR